MESPPPIHPCLCCSLISPCSLFLSVNAHKPLGTVYKKFIGSYGRVESLMLNVGSVAPPPPPPLPIRHATTRSSRACRSKGGAGRKSVIYLYTLLIGEFKCGNSCFCLEVLHRNYGSAWSRMLIYFLIFPGSEIVIADGAQRPARNHEELHVFVLPVPPRVREVNKNETHKKEKPSGKV